MTYKIDITTIIKEKRITELLLGDISNIPIILKQYYNENGYIITVDGVKIVNESVIGCVVSKGILLNSLDNRFYIEIQLFKKDIKISDIVIDSIEYRFSADDKYLEIVSFVVLED